MNGMFRNVILNAGAVVASAFFVGAAWAADVLVLGEIHDNPHHHRVQADLLETAAPRAVVFEMLTQAEADALRGVARDANAMRAATDGFHWGNIADYADVLAHSAVIVGAALPRDAVREAFGAGAATVFGGGAEVYGLNSPLPADQQKVREALQFAAHCDAMPLEMMGGMVEAQRLRDAAFARAVVEAVETYGTPVALITGNGHARMDWGVPSYLVRVRPDLVVESIGQGEGGMAPEGVFTSVLNDAPIPDRPDPCAAFR